MPARLRRLPAALVSRIAAGEVIERPAAVVKELVENALDADAGRIDVRIEGAGCGAIIVRDDSGGMDRDALALAVERHATSKLPTDDLVRIATLGFRGEALPSIGSVARLCIASRARGAGEAWRLDVDAGRAAAPCPDSQPAGTRVEVRDLFYTVPARLKFLKQPRTEQAHAADVVRRLAMARPEVGFSFEADGRRVLEFPAAPGDARKQRRERLRQALGREFVDCALAVDATAGTMGLAGLAALPTYSRPSAQSQFLFVNGRPVRDRLLHGAVRAAYHDVLARDRHAVLALFLDLDPIDVDVNVHPTKAEVRFRDAGRVRGLVVAALRQALAGAGHRAAAIVAAATVPARSGAAQGSFAVARSIGAVGLAEATTPFAAALGPPAARIEADSAPAPPSAQDAAAHPLGAARAQLHGTYVLAETADGVVLIDQHAAHERIVRERIRAGLAGPRIARQILLTPEVVELDPAATARLLAHTGELADLGLILEPFGDDAVVVREVPAVLGRLDLAALVRDLADDVATLGDAASLRDRLGDVCATASCHGSVRAGRALNGAEMNALLREMETTPNAGQCSHGRPTWVEWKLADIERWFGRR